MKYLAAKKHCIRGKSLKVSEEMKVGGEVDVPVGVVGMPEWTE